jgi:hypothetical protein
VKKLGLDERANWQVRFYLKGEDDQQEKGTINVKHMHDGLGKRH